MAQNKVEMTTRLLIIYILSFLTCSHASISRGPFGLRNSLSIEVSSSSWNSLELPRSSVWVQPALQIRGGESSTETISTNDETDEKTAESESVVETPAQNDTSSSSVNETEEETVNVEKEIEELEESDLDAEDEIPKVIEIDDGDEEESDLDTEEEISKAVEIDVDGDEEDFYTDSEDSESDRAVEEEVDDVEKENLEIAIETAVKVSKRAGTLALKFSKVASVWIRQWSWDLYQACGRAVGACREELAEGGEVVKLTKAETKDATRAQLFRKKTWKITKLTCNMMWKMTIAFWAVDDNDILPDKVKSFKPDFSFLDKLKLRSDSEEENKKGKDAIKQEKSASSSDGRRKKRKIKRVRKKKTTAPLTSTKAPKKEEKAVVTVVPKVRNGKRIMMGLTVGLVCGFFWEQFGISALIVKGISGLPTKYKPWHKEASLADTEES